MKNLASLLILLAVLFSGLQPYSANAAAGKPDPVKIEQFVDSQMAQAIAAKKIPGGVVVVTQGEEILFQKAYGLANIEKNIPFDVERSIISLGSTGKIATALGVLREVEVGRLDLEAPVADLLAEQGSPVKLNNPFGEAVRLRHLLTHTAGLDEEILGKGARSAAAVRPLESYLARRLPPVMLEPGRYWSYSNLGISLAGYLAQLSSGQDFASYVDEHIFQVLGMARSTMRQPGVVPEDMVTGYTAINGQFQAMPPFYLNDWPAGGMTTTAADWAKLMMALVSGGSYAGSQILKPETLNEMMTPQYAAHPAAANKMGWVFWLETRAGQRIAHHGGFGGGQSTEMLLLPDLHAGILVQTNSTDTSVRDNLPYQIAARFFPAPAGGSAAQPKLPRPAPAAASATLDVSGTYRYPRYPHTTWPKIGLITGDMAFEKQAELLANGAIRLGSEVYTPQGKDVYATPGGKKTIQLERGADGRVSAIFDDFGNALLRVPWWDDIRGLLPLVLICLGLLISALYWAFEKPLRRLFQRGPVDERPGPRRARLAATILSLAPLAAGIAFQIILGSQRTDLFTYAWSLPNNLMLIIGLTVLVCSVLTACFAIQAWRKGWWGVGDRLHYSLVAFGGIGLTLFLAILQFYNLRNFII